MKKFMGGLKRGSESSSRAVQPTNGSSEGGVAGAINQFCGAAGVEGGDEVLHLPTIVELAESSPRAAKEAADTIRAYLKESNNGNPHAQYNAIMLIRILSDHPGRTFTINLNDKFAKTTKDLLRTSWDPSVQQLLRETLENLTKDKASDPNLKALSDMWLKEKSKNITAQGVPQAVQSNQSFVNTNQGPQQPHYHHRNKSRRLPPMNELVSRIEEARTSAKLLQQVVGSTPKDELLNNELVKEFVERCSMAQRSIQSFIKAEDPHPDDDTMLTLINTNDQLSAALSSHHRALLEARKAAGLGTPQQGQQYTGRDFANSPPQQALGQQGSSPYLPSTAPPQSEPFFSSKPAPTQTILQPQPVRATPQGNPLSPSTVSPLSGMESHPNNPFRDPAGTGGNMPSARVTNPDNAASTYSTDGIPVEQHMVSLGYMNDGASREGRSGNNEKIALDEESGSKSGGLQAPLLPEKVGPEGDITPPESTYGANVNGVQDHPRQDSNAVSVDSREGLPPSLQPAQPPATGHIEYRY